MKFSNFLIPTLREPPKDADTLSSKLMFRSGMIRKIASGLYDWLPLGLRTLKKVEQIVREEMNRAGGLEVWLPHVQPRELWEETGRWQIYGKELLRFKDRKGSEFCFAPTAEEVITDLVRRDVRSYRQLPLMVYQFGTKFRDEIRPRFGVMRAREFYMKDAYSFHANEEDAERYYKVVFDAYMRIFERCGLNFRSVEAESGAIGGSFSHEFMVLAETGEEEIASCSACGYAANVERAECLAPGYDNHEKVLPLEEFPTPNLYTVEDIAKLTGAPREKFIKTMFYVADEKPVVALVRGDCELNEFKLARSLSAQKVEKMSEENYAKLADCDVGFAGPAGLKERCLRHDPRTLILADTLLEGLANGISGANKKDVHAKNINIGRDYKPDRFADLRKARAGDLCPRCPKEKAPALTLSRGIEVGHTFKLGTKYSAAMNANYLDEAGKSHPFVMGCYGIGVSRVVAAAIEQGHDEQGIIWPAEIAPFQALIVPVNFAEPKSRECAERLCKDFEAAGIDALLDDRDERAGIKFKDADLTGIPLRVTVSEKGLAAGTVEFKGRKDKEARRISPDAVPAEAKKFLKMTD